MVADDLIVVGKNGSDFDSEQVFRCEITCEYCVVERSSVGFFNPNLVYVSSDLVVCEMCVWTGSENLVLIAVVAVGGVFSRTVSVTVFSASVSDSDSVFDADSCAYSTVSVSDSAFPLSEQDKRDNAVRISARDNEINFFIKYPFLSVTKIV